MWPWAVALALFSLALAGTVAGANESGADGSLLVESSVRVLLLLAFFGAGALLLSKRPDHPVSWLLPLPGIYMALEAGVDLANAVLSPTAAVWFAWAAETSWGWTFPTLAVFLPLLFPTGAPPTPRWRWAGWTGAAGIIGITVGNAVSPELLEPVANPADVGPDAALAAISGIGFLLFAVAFVASIVSAVVRHRRSVGVERQQLRWFVRGAACVPVGWAVAIALETGPYNRIGGPVLAACLALMVAAVTIAVLKYRLYDIDRVVSRTVSYALLTGVLVGVYALGVLGIGELLPGERSDLLVAGSTLSVAAAFRPLRARIQGAVDRRFNRARFEAAKVIEEFGTRLRDEVDLPRLSADLRGVVQESFQPVAAGLWLQTEEVGGNT